MDKKKEPKKMVSLELPVSLIRSWHKRAKETRRTKTTVALIALEKELGL